MVGDHVESAGDMRSSTPEYDFSQIDEKKLMRKIDWKLIPWLCVLYLLSFLDRSAIGNAKLYGLQTDLNLSNLDYQICLTVFFFPCKWKSGFYGKPELRIVRCFGGGSFEYLTQETISSSLVPVDHLLRWDLYDVCRRSKLLPDCLLIRIQGSRAMHQLCWSSICSILPWCGRSWSISRCQLPL